MNDHRPPPIASTDDHARCWALIPWLVNGRAAGDEQRLAMTHLAHCAACRTEWQAQQDLARALQGAPVDAQALPDAEAGLQRLLGRLDVAPPAPPARRTVSRLTWALAAAVVVQAVGLVALSLQGAHQDRADYAPLSQRTTPASPGAATLRIQPAGDLPLAQWHALLQAHDLVVVEGPNSAGAYGVAPRRGAADPAAAERLARLRATPGLLLVEPLGRP